MRVMGLVIALALSLTACADIEAQRKYEARQAAIKQAEKSVEGLRAAGRAMVVMHPKIRIAGQPRDYDMSVMFARIGPADVDRFQSVGSGLNLVGVSDREAGLNPDYPAESFPAGEYYFTLASGNVLIDNVSPKRILRAKYDVPGGEASKLGVRPAPPDLVLAPGEVVFLGDLLFSGTVCDNATIRLQPSPGDLEAARAALARTHPALAPALTARPFQCAFCPGFEAPVRQADAPCGG